MPNFKFEESDNNDTKKDKPKMNRQRYTYIKSLHMPSKLKANDDGDQKVLKKENEQSIIPRENKKSKEDEISLDKLAQMIAEKHKIIVTDNHLRKFDDSLKYYKLLKESEEDKIIRQLIPPQYRCRTNIYTTAEICRWMKAIHHPVDIYKAEEEQKYLINFRGSIYDVLSDEIVKYRDDMYFTDFVNTYYPIGYRPRGDEFKKFIKVAFGDDEDSLKLLQEVVGLILSNIRDLKVGIFFYGMPDSGKTLLIEVLREIVGFEFSTSVSFHQLSSEPYAIAELYGSKLNAFGEMTELDIKRLDIFKALTSTDIITTRRIYGKHFQFRNKALLLFAGNNFPRIKTEDLTNAFFNRLIIIPFLNSIPKEQQDSGLKEKLLSESDYIVEWGMEGLRRLIQNNYVFTKSKLSEKIKREYINQNNSFQAFLVEACNFENDSYMFSYEIEGAYKIFCDMNDLAPMKKNSIHYILKHVQKLRYHKKDAKNGSKRNGYSGIKLKKEYRILLEEYLSKKEQ